MHIRFYAINHGRLNCYRFIQYRFPHLPNFLFTARIFIKLKQLLKRNETDRIHLGSMQEVMFGFFIPF